MGTKEMKISWLHNMEYFQFADHVIAMCEELTIEILRQCLKLRMAKVVSRNVWHFRAWRKSFPEGIGISAHGESRFPKGLAFPRSAKVVSRKVWHFRAWRKSFPEWFGISALGESRFPKGLAFPRLAKVVSRKV